jgi:hypothetical protein
MPDVQELLESKSTSDHTKWRMARVDYCKLRDPSVDPPTSQKPTVFLTYGYDFINAQCYPGNRCDLMLPDGVHHRYCIRNNSDQPAEQERIEDPILRSRIPRGCSDTFAPSAVSRVNLSQRLAQRPSSLSKSSSVR